MTTNNTQPANRRRSIEFSPFYLDDITLDQAVIIQQLAGCDPTELLNACREGRALPGHVSAILLIAARRIDPTVQPEDLRMSWADALGKAADVMLEGLRAHERREQTEHPALRAAVSIDPDPDRALASRLLDAHPGMEEALRAALNERAKPQPQPPRAQRRRERIRDDGQD